jgi:hypothetical protein
MHWFYHNWLGITNVSLFSGIKEISGNEFLEEHRKVNLKRQEVFQR